MAAYVRAFGRRCSLNCRFLLARPRGKRILCPQENQKPRLCSLIGAARAGQGLWQGGCSYRGNSRAQRPLIGAAFEFIGK